MRWTRCGADTGERGSFGIRGITHRTRPKINPVLDLTVFEPASTRLLPYCGLVKFVEMRINLIQRILLYTHGLDALRLHLLHALDAVLYRRLDTRYQGTIAPSCARSNNGVVVGETWRGNTHVKIRATSPILLYRAIGAVDNFEGWFESDLETSGAHNGIQFVDFPIDRLDSFRDYTFNTAKYRRYVVLYQCLQKAIARGDAPTSDRPFGYNGLFELFVTGTHAAVHLLGDDVLELILQRRVLLVHAE